MVVALSAPLVEVNISKVDADVGCELLEDCFTVECVLVIVSFFGDLDYFGSFALDLERSWTCVLCFFI